MLRLTNPQMRYAWGSVELLQGMLGTDADGRPLAEIWMGAHPSAPSAVTVGGDQVALDHFIASEPELALGEDAARRSAALPFLLKLLAADRPLSLQVHPTREQAATGYAAEDAAGIALDDPNRNYRDTGHKPEMLFALTSFELMCGFRPVPVVVELLTGLGAAEVAPLVELLRAGEPVEALRAALTSLLTGELSGRSVDSEDRVLRAVVEAARARRGERVEYARVVELAREHPGDLGVVASLFLNYLQLVPGEAVFVGAGMVHSYVRGLGVELMATSDNVLRAGLTSKHVDVPEMLRLVDFAPGEPARLRPTAVDGASLYTPPVDDFALWIREFGPDEATGGGPRAGAAPAAGPPSGARIALGCAGVSTITRTRTAREPETVQLRPGESAFIPAADGPVDVSTSGLVVVAFQP